MKRALLGKKLLVATAGLATIVYSGCKKDPPVGNLVAPPPTEIPVGNLVAPPPTDYPVGNLVAPPPVVDAGEPIGPPTASPDSGRFAPPPPPKRSDPLAK
jgi:hypothetical protein